MTDEQLDIMDRGAPDELHMVIAEVRRLMAENKRLVDMDREAEKICYQIASKLGVVQGAVIRYRAALEKIVDLSFHPDATAIHDEIYHAAKSALEANTMTEERLAEIEARANAATKGPWLIAAGDWDRVIREDGRMIRGCADRDLDFIAHSRHDVPDLIAEIRRLKAKP